LLGKVDDEIAFGGRWFFPVVFSAILVMCLGVFITMTKQGIGATPDSTIYIMSAYNLDIGNGLTVSGEPMVHYPPGYPLLIAAFTRAGEELSWLRWVHGFIYLLNTSIFLLLVCLVTEKNRWLFLLCSLFWASSKGLMELHVNVWSETPFLTFFLSGIYFLMLWYRDEEKRRRYLLISATLFSISCLMRYAGLAFPAGIAIGIMFTLRRERRVALQSGFLFGFISLMPIGLVMLRRALISENTGEGGGFHFKAFDTGLLTQGVRTLRESATGILSPNYLGVLMLILFCVLVVQIVLGYRKKLDENDDLGSGDVHGIVCLSLTAAGYLFFLMFSHMVVYASTPFDFRILSPLIILLLIILVSMTGYLFRNDVNVPLKRSILIFGFLVFVLKVPEQYQETKYHSQAGIGFNSPSWHQSQMVRTVEELPDVFRIYSNAPDIFRLHAKREAEKLPTRVLHGFPNSNFDTELEETIQTIKDGEGIIIFMNAVSWRVNLAGRDEVEDALGFAPIIDFQEGSLFISESGLSKIR